VLALPVPPPESCILGDLCGLSCSALAGTPVWSVLLSLILCCTGVFLFKRWEAGMPLHEQFSWGEVSAKETPALELVARAASDGDGEEHARAAEGAGLLAPMSPPPPASASSAAGTTPVTMPGSSLRRVLAGVLSGGGAATGSQSEHLLLWEEQGGGNTSAIMA
jgi:hypothetical protein